MHYRLRLLHSEGRPHLGVIRFCAPGRGLVGCGRFRMPLFLGVEPPAPRGWQLPGTIAGIQGADAEAGEFGVLSHSRKEVLYYSGNHIVTAQALVQTSFVLHRNNSRSSVRVVRSGGQNTTRVSSIGAQQVGSSSIRPAARNSDNCRKSGIRRT